VLIFTLRDDWGRELRVEKDPRGTLNLLVEDGAERASVELEPEDLDSLLLVLQEWRNDQTL
jgi:hypothetical protein